MNGDDQLSNKNTKYLYNRVRKVDDTDKKISSYQRRQSDLLDTAYKKVNIFLF